MEYINTPRGRIRSLGEKVSKLITKCQFVRMGWKLMSNGLWKVTPCCTQGIDYSGVEWVDLCCGLLARATRLQTRRYFRTRMR